MSASSIGSLVLIIAGLGFLAAAVATFRRLRHEPDRRVASGWGLVIDVLVGLVALGDGTMSALGAPDRAVVWSIGTLVLVVAGALLVVHRQHSV